MRVKQIILRVMKTYNLTKAETTLFLEAVRDGKFTFDNFTANTGIPPIYYAHCVKEAEGVRWSIKPLPMIDQYIWSRYKERMSRPKCFALDKKEKTLILMGCLKGYLLPEALPRIFPLEQKAVIGALLYTGFDKSEYTQKKLPALPDNIKINYDPVQRASGYCWGFCASFIEDHISKGDECCSVFDYFAGVSFDCNNVTIIRRLLDGVLFYLKT